MNKKGIYKANRSKDKEKFSLILDRESIQYRKKEDKVFRKKRGSAFEYFSYVGEIGFTIALPIASGGVLGAFLDRRFHTYPKITLLLLFLGILVSIGAFIRYVQDVVERSRER